MKQYPEYKELNLPNISESVLKYWSENQVFDQSISTREGKPSFTFFEGPPSANGTPGIHHVMARTIKDVFCRFKTLEGYQVKRKGGWDTHGLPVELQVEKELGITKEDIGTKITVEEYNKKCRETVMRFKAQWDELTVKMGYWVDLDNPYITFENEYIESCWYLLKELYKKDLLYKGYTIQPFSPAAGTGLSSHELNQPGCYRDVKDTSIVAQFKVKSLSKNLQGFKNLTGLTDNLYILAWTTTPWTLPSNAALAVGEKIDYLLVKSFNPYTFKAVNVVLAKDLVGKYFNDKAKELAFEDYKSGDKLIPWSVEAEFKGADLVGTTYEQLLPYVNTSSVGKTFEVIAGDFVSTSDGTGIVHIAPTFGADDARVAKVAGIAPITVKDSNDNDVPLVNRQGKFVVNITDEVFGFGGEYVKAEYLTEAEAELARKGQESVLVAKGVVSKVDKYISVDDRIGIKLKLENKAFKVEKYEHSYPHCWRTDKPVLYYPLDSWFIRTTAVKDKLVALNNKINWKPESTGTGRFGNWLENLVDWNLSRSRYWGTPLPIWRTEDGTEEICIGSQAELAQEIEKANKSLNLAQANALTDLHRPYVDNVVLVSSTGKPMKRELDLIDVWFDSGAMPFAQWGYKGDNSQLPFGQGGAFPADFISEGVDQTRGWFFTLHAIAGMLFDEVAFKNVVSTGLVLDKNGEKMSKRKGNVIDPFATLGKYGPDATRWYMVSNANPWDNLKFDLDGIQEVQRKIFGTLYNTYNFFAIYSNLDKYTVTKTMSVESRPEFDRWILSELQLLIQKVTESYSNYDVTAAARAIENFVDADLSNWYVRLSRKRFWKGELNDDKKAAYETLFECLDTLAQLMSPIAPFFGEWLYQNLNGTDTSVHLSILKKANTALINPELSESMAIAQKSCSLIHSVRKNNSLRVRLPLAKVYVNLANDSKTALLQKVTGLIKDETNIKDVVAFDSSASSDLFTKSVLPDLKKLGKALGSKINEVKNLLNNLSQQDIAKLEKEGLTLTFADGTIHELSKEDVLIKTADAVGMASASDGDITVAVDTNMTEDLKKEGIARDLVNRIQNIRKESGFEVTDKIVINIQKKDAYVDSAISVFKDYICNETQAKELSILDVVTNAQLVDMDGFELSLSMTK
ncbi:MAG: isoleucine--tRNA ligase [Cytophagales bacterium]